MFTLENSLIVIGCLVLLAILTRKPREQKKQGKISGEFRPCVTLNTRTEQVFKKVLDSRLPSNLEVHCKVRLADIVRPVDRKNFTSLNKVTSKHVDFVLAEVNTSNIVCAIELDDKSHSSKRAKVQDKEKNYALDSARVPLYRVQTGANYQDAVTQILANHL